MEIVDSHFHVWDLERFSYPWPTPDDDILYKDFTVNSLVGTTAGLSVKHAVFVQVLNKSTQEIDWVLDLTKKHPLIKGIVGGFDLTAPDLESTLERYANNPKLVGARHILDFEDEKWITRDDVGQGLALLEKYGLTYDLLLRPQYLKYIPKVVGRFQGLKFVVDHIAKPYIKAMKIEGWKEEMAEIAKHPNVFCKISGLVNEADIGNWKREDFLPYVKHIVEIFGEDRCMFGSDFPVFYKAAPDYATVLDLAKWLVSSCGITEEGTRKIFCRNAVSFYNLKLED